MVSVVSSMNGFLLRQGRPQTTQIEYLWCTATLRLRPTNFPNAPYLTNGLKVWGQARKSYLDRLLKLQKRALRFIHFSDRSQHAIPLFSDAGILPLQFSYYELTANPMFVIRHRIAPRNIRDLFQDISNTHSYNTRSSASNNFYKQSFRLYSIELVF